MKTKMVAFVLLAMLLALVTTPVYADVAPSLPHAFYGAVEINGSPAPVGTSVKVMGDGVQTGVGNNPIVTIVEGEYGGGTNPMAPKLIVQGTIADGATVTFYVNGFDTGQTAQWHSGYVTEVNLAATIEEGAVPDEPDDSTPPDTGDSTPPDTGDSAPLLPPSEPPAGSGGVPVLWLVIGGAVLVGLIIAFWIARSRAY